MRRYAYLMTFMAVMFLALFAVAEFAGIGVLTDPDLDGSRPAVAGVGVALLLVDVVLPVPASLVMVAFGAAFGFAGGAVLALVGSVGATMLGFWLGRAGGPLLDRVVPAPERLRFDAVFDRWGVLIVLVTRPIPIVAETVAVVAGTTSLPWSSLVLAAVLGALPAAVLYAATGAAAARLDNGLLVFGLVMSIAGLTWLIGTWLRRGAPIAESGR